MMMVPAAGEHAADAVAHRDLGAWDLGGGGAAHLAHALLQCVHAGMHVGKAAAIGVERQFAGGGVAVGDEGAGLALWHEAEVFEPIDRQMRKACPWQRTRGRRRSSGGRRHCG
jgi:hypothetical protein